MIKITVEYNVDTPDYDGVVFEDVPAKEAARILFALQDAVPFEKRVYTPS